MGKRRSDQRVPELVAPAGTVEKLKVALAYGADAVYFGGERHNLRARAGNLSDEDVEAAVRYVHSAGKRAYLALNAIPHNDDLDGLERAVDLYANSKPDAFIVSDPGVLQIVRAMAPAIPVHLSTQANAVNWRSVEYWHEQGVSRVILAREMTLDEVRETRGRTNAELEAFVHGAMCISYSGRCLLSTYLAGRDANRGECAHPCRWKYVLVEETRPGEYFEIDEDKKGTYILNSRDLCMVEYMPELIESGLDALKIEGRMKSVHYVAVVTKAYRRAIDACAGGVFTRELAEELLTDLSSVSHRPFTTGFWFGLPTDQGRFGEFSSYLSDAEFVGIVKEVAGDGTSVVEARNRIKAGEEIEVISPRLSSFRALMPEMVRVFIDDQECRVREVIDQAHANSCLEVRFGRPVEQYSLLRRRIPDRE